LKIGQQVVVPLQTPSVSSATSSPDNRLASNAEATSVKPSAVLDHTVKYTVHRGQSLGDISRQIGVSVDEICRQNRIKNRNKIYPGQRLKIVVPGGPLISETSQVVKPVKYTVQPGDTLHSIARKHGQEPEDLVKLNKLRSNTVYPGQELIISAH
jgi:LysM repeat protein